MAGRELTPATKVKASTLLEVIIAMVIIVLVFGIAMMIHANVMRLSLSAKKIKAQAILQEIALEAERAGNFTTGSRTQDEFRIETTQKTFPGDTLLNEIDLAAYDLNNQEITELQKIVFK